MLARTNDVLNVNFSLLKWLEPEAYINIQILTGGILLGAKECL